MQSRTSRTGTSSLNHALEQRLAWGPRCARGGDAGEPLSTTTGRRAHVAAALVVLLACSPRPTSAPLDPVAAPPETIAAPPPPPEAIEAAPRARAPIDFDPSAVVLGSCGAFGSDYDDPGGPFVVGPEVARWAEGEPLRVMTNAGGVVEAVAGRRLDRCGDESPRDEAPGAAEGGREESEGEGGPGCVPAVAIVTDASLVCDPILPSGIPEGLSLGDHERERGLLFALPRHVRPPRVIPMRFEVRVEGVCRREEAEGGARAQGPDQGRAHADGPPFHPAGAELDGAAVAGADGALRGDRAPGGPCLLLGRRPDAAPGGAVGRVRRRPRGDADLVGL